MFRRPRAIIVLCLLALAAACSGAPAPLTTPSYLTPTQMSAAAGSLPAAGIELMVSGSVPQIAAYQQLVAAYQQRHPGQPVQLVGIPGDEDYQGRLSADVAAGTVPDVIIESYTNVPGLAARGIITAAAPLLAASHVLSLDDFAVPVYTPFIFDRQLQCVPLSASGLVVYYNQELFQKAALAAPGARWTRSQFLADARALTLDSNADGRPEQYGVGVTPSLQNLAPFIWQLHGRLVDSPAWPSEMELSAPAIYTATRWLVSLQTQYHVAPDQAAELGESSDQRFQDGRLAMLIDTPERVPAFRQITSFHWDVAPMPADNANPTNVIVADGLCLTAAARDKAAAWQFIEFAASAEGQSLLGQAGAIVPAATAVVHSAAYLGVRTPHNQVFLDALNHALPLPKLENWTDIQAIVDEELQQAFYGQKDVAQALLAATTRSEEYFKIHVAN
jgi:multiple sugar transport system substrate-binding protein